MKNIFKTFMAAAVLITGFASCEDEQDLIYVNPAASFEILSPQSGESVILNKDTPDNPALSLTWEDADYGTATEVSYTVQIDETGNEFAAPIDLISTTNTYASIDMAALNSAVLAAGLPFDVASSIDVRIRSTVGTGGAEEAFSNTITYIVTPYQPFTPVQDLFLVGGATEHGWENNANNAPLFRDPENQYQYYYTGYFNPDGFKVLASRGNWHPQYGATADGVLGVSGEDGSNEPPQIMVPSAGYYTFTMNTQDMTYTLEPFDASGAVSFDSVGIIGAATPGGWDTDTDLTNSAQNPHLWRLESIDLTEDVVKFRANDAWDLPGNWGGGTPVSGQVQENGGDFQAVPVAGNYEVWFNDLDRRYIFIQN